MQELKLVSDDANVYKLVGPALIKQDPLEAKANVNERIEFVSGELERLDNQLKSLETKSNEKQEEVWHPTHRCRPSFASHCALFGLRLVSWLQIS